MGARFMCCLFVGFVGALFISGKNAQTTHDAEGQACASPGGGTGVCLQLVQCPHVVRAIIRGVRNHSRCGFVGAVELVCCEREPLGAATASTSPPTTPPSGSSPGGSHLLPPHVERHAVSTLPPAAISVAAAATADTSSESYVEDMNSEVEDDDLEVNRVVADTDNRLFIGNNDRNRGSPTRFALNTLTGFVNAIFGKPPAPSRITTSPPRQVIHVVTRPSIPFVPRATAAYAALPVSTRKPQNNLPPTILSSSSTQLPVLDVQPNEIITPDPKPSSTPLSDHNTSTSWQNVRSTYSPSINNAMPEYAYVMKPSPLPESVSSKPCVPAHVPIAEMPHLDETTVPNLVTQSPRPPGVYTLVNSARLTTPKTSEPNADNEILEVSTPPVRLDFEPTPTETTVRPDLQPDSSEVLMTPDVPFVTPVSPGMLDFESLPSENRPLEDEERPSTEPPSELEPPTQNTLVGRKSQEACARYREIPKLTRYIVGGDFAAHGEFPHMVALGFQKPRETQLSWLCGGTLLSEDFVLTAAHCVNTRFGRPLAARVGYTNVSADAATGAEVPVDAVWVHPAYAPLRRAHDVALLRLATPLRFSQFAHPACLHAQHAPPPGPLLVSGWGSVTPDGSTPTDHLKRALVTPIDDRTCREFYRNIFRLEMICATGEDVDTCKGDSGGPMQYLEEPTSAIYTVVGVTSFGPNPCAAERPGVYSRVASYLPWIESVVWPN